MNPSIGEESVNICNNRENNTTIIKLSENGTEINSTLIPSFKDRIESTSHTFVEPMAPNDNSKNTVKVNVNSGLSACNNNQQNMSNDGKLADICFVSRKCSTKTVIVEVHRGTSEQAPNFDGKIRCKIPPPPPIRFSNQEKSCPSNAKNVPTNNERTSLNTAISEELKRRLEVS